MTVQEIGINRTEGLDLQPQVESGVFDSRPDAQFWMGVVALGDCVVMPNERHAAGLMRANMYIDKHGFLEESARKADGTESDEDDERSTHFVVIENTLATTGINRVVATTRLIEKDFEDDPLPVERLFPEAFENNPAPVGSAEASRFMAHYPENKFTQGSLMLGLVRAMTTRAAHHGLEPVYAVVEEKLMRRFNQIGLPYDEVSEMRMVPEYNTPNVAIKFEPSKIIEQANLGGPGDELLQLVFNKSAVRAEGLGYYDESLITPLPRVRRTAA